MIYWQRLVHTVFCDYVFSMGLGLGNADQGGSVPPPAGVLDTYRANSYASNSFASKVYRG